MRKLLSLLVLLGLTVPAAVAQGQMKLNTTWKCNIVEPVAAVPVTGQADHAYSVYAVKCAATKGSVFGVKEKEGTATEFAEMMGTKSKIHGIFVETLTNGDAVTYEYTGAATMNGKVLATGSNSWTMVSGTGKAKGGKGSGTCSAKPNADGSTNFECTGTYSAGK